MRRLSPEMKMGTAAASATVAIRSTRRWIKCSIRRTWLAVNGCPWPAFWLFLADLKERHVLGLASF